MMTKLDKLFSYLDKLIQLRLDAYDSRVKRILDLIEQEMHNEYKIGL